MGSMEEPLLTCLPVNWEMCETKNLLWSQSCSFTFCSHLRDETFEKSLVDPPVPPSCFTGPSHFCMMVQKVGDPYCMQHRQLPADLSASQRHCPAQVPRSTHTLYSPATEKLKWCGSPISEGAPTCLPVLLCHKWERYEEGKQPRILLYLHDFTKKKNYVVTRWPTALQGKEASAFRAQEGEAYWTQR